MRCPRCGSAEKHRVIETRRDEAGNVTRRRRCPSCHQDYVTAEQLSTRAMHVRKASGETSAFSRRSIARSITKAAVRAFKPGQLETMVDAVVAAVYPLASDGAIPTTAIGQAVLKEL